MLLLLDLLVPKNDQIIADNQLDLLWLQSDIYTCRKAHSTTTTTPEKEIEMKEISEYNQMAQNMVGETREVIFQKDHAHAGEYEVLGFIPTDPEYTYWSNGKGESGVNYIKLGYLKVQLKGTKLYSKAPLRIELLAWVGTDELFVTRQLENGKLLRAYYLN